MSNDKFSLKSFLLLCLMIVGLISVVILYPKLTKAEIATTTDWIGLFRADSSGLSDCGTNGTTSCDSKLGTINGTTWFYTSSCAQTPGSTPKLERLNADACTFPIPADPLPDGDYEYRLYANNEESTDALLAKSKKFTTSPISAPPTNCPAQTVNPRVKSGLISTPKISVNFGNPEGICVVDPKAAFAPQDIDPYEDLKSKYYTQSKAVKVLSISTTLNSIASGDNGKVFNYTASEVTFNDTTEYTGTAVIFIEGNLTIKQNITTSDPKQGLVLVVKGNVNIDPAVKQIDAVIISSGTIYTAADFALIPPSCGKNSVNVGAATNALTVNGSLVSLTGGSIVFCRILTDNSCDNCSAEKINYQPKYLVIMRDLYSDNPPKWSEIP